MSSCLMSWESLVTSVIYSPMVMVVMMVIVAVMVMVMVMVMVVVTWVSLVMPLISPPTIDFSPDPMSENMFRLFAWWIKSDMF